MIFFFFLVIGTLDKYVNDYSASFLGSCTVRSTQFSVAVKRSCLSKLNVLVLSSVIFYVEEKPSAFSNFREFEGAQLACCYYLSSRVPLCS